jgi:hypothetical protein
MALLDHAQEIRTDIETALHRRRAKQGTPMYHAEDVTKRGLDVVFHFGRSFPYFSALAVGAGVLMAAASLGVTELALGALATFGALQVFKGRETATQAVRELLRRVERPE